MAELSVTKTLLASTLALCALSPAIAADKPALMTGASTSMLANTCVGCHGDAGISRGPATPSIAGISTLYFDDIMKGFKSGDVPSTIMGRIAQGYSDQEIEQMAGYFAKLPFMNAEQTFNAKLVKKGAKLHDKYCEKCHADGGSSAEDDAGILAGQWVPYMRWSLADFTSGERTPPKKMKKKLKKLQKKEGDRGLDALMSYYASQQ